MPGSDHTGPEGEGPKTGRGLGDCGNGSDKKTPETQSRGFLGGFRRGQGGQGGRGGGFGRGRGWGFWNKPWFNSDSKCVCPACGYSQPHNPGNPCSSINCPECNTRLIRE
ncbi:MAG: DUF5320 domain-containing protein [Anaerolineales bacterium]|nr:DUF5320 domain-containing protein [Anaerolineales bacterium]